jgi:hypothetical protein
MTIIRIVFALMIMAGWTGQILDVRGAFYGENLYLKVPQGMEQYYGISMYLLLRKTLYGLKQSAFRFWIFLLEIVGHLQCSRSKADPCLYFRWTDTPLLWFSWVDDCFITGPTEELLELKGNIMDCDDSGKIKEFVPTQLITKLIREPGRVVAARGTHCRNQQR